MARTTIFASIVIALVLVLSACATGGSAAQKAADEAFIDCMGDHGFRMEARHFSAQVTGDPPHLVTVSILAAGDGLQAAAQACIPEAERAVDRLST